MKLFSTFWSLPSLFNNPASLLFSLHAVYRRVKKHTVYIEQTLRDWLVAISEDANIPAIDCSQVPTSEKYV